MTTSRTGILIALSAGGEKNELARYGYGLEHINELMVRMSRRLLQGGHRLAFGGTFGVPRQTLTENLIHTAQNWLEDGAARGILVTAPETWPLHNYSAWPYYCDIDVSEIARLVGICEFISVNPEGTEAKALEPLCNNWRQNPKARAVAAEALTRMRVLSTRDSALRIVWGGKIQGSSGWLPGIFEEVVTSLRQHKPVLVFGGLGGCARIVADYLNDPLAPWPSELTLETCADEERDESLSGKDFERIEQQMRENRALLEQFRQTLYGDSPICGLPPAVFRRHLLTENTRTLITHAATVADSLCSGTSHDF